MIVSHTNTHTYRHSREFSICESVSNGYYSQGWGRQKLVALNPIPNWQQGPASAVFPGASAGIHIKNRTARIQAIIHIWPACIGSSSLTLCLKTSILTQGFQHLYELGNQIAFKLQHTTQLPEMHTLSTNKIQPFHSIFPKS